jgi:hypothetical protein
MKGKNKNIGFLNIFENSGGNGKYDIPFKLLPRLPDLCGKE